MTDLFLAALLASVPLPLTGLVPWWAAVLYALPLAWQIRLDRKGMATPALDVRMMNALSLACLALFMLDLLFISRRLIHVAVHLSLSLIVLKAFHLRTARDRAQFALLAFFLAVAGAANSTHPALALHLLVLLALFTSWLMQAAGLPRRPARRLAAGLAFACIVLAAPLFLFLPRFRGPYVPVGQQREAESKTFTLDSLGLEGVAGSKDDRRIALRVRFEGGSVGEEQLRLRVRTFGEYRKGRWRPSSVRYRLRRFSGSGVLWLGVSEARDGRTMEAFPKDLSPQYLPLPYDAAGLEARLAYAHAGSDGTVRLSLAVARSQFIYTVFLDAKAAPVPDEPADSDLVLPEGIERSLRDLAAAIMPGDLDAPAQAGAMVRHFAAGYRYALEDYGGVDDPLREFLFVRKRGHCELYATAGALLLRARGIPARVAVGFMGGELNPLQDYYMVRFSNAHAWVEAWLDGAWVVVDPTPPEYRPAVMRGVLSAQAALLWETVSFWWDRHVIGFAFADQVGLTRVLADGAGSAGRALAWLAGAVALAWAALRAARRIRREPVILARYRRLRRGMARLLDAEEASLSPEAVERAFNEREPALAADAAAFFRAYGAASFGRGGSTEGDLGRAYRALKRGLKTWREAQRPR